MWAVNIVHMYLFIYGLSKRGLKIIFTGSFLPARKVALKMIRERRFFSIHWVQGTQKDHLELTVSTLILRMRNMHWILSYWSKCLVWLVQFGHIFSDAYFSNPNAALTQKNCFDQLRGPLQFSSNLKWVFSYLAKEIQWKSNFSTLTNF